MAQIIDTSNPEETIVRSDLQIPADAQGSQVEKKVVVVDTFLEGEQRDTITFVLDERFRERVDAALVELLNRGTGIVFNPKDAPNRDLANSIRLNLGGEEGNPRASIIMKHDVNREEQVSKIVDTKFREFV